jgi:Lrp/AsnC family leucine-responsive transcriptional regulator
LNTTEAGDYPEVVEIHKLSGDYCTLLKVRAASIEHLEGIIDRIGHNHGELRTSIVMSTQFADRPVEAPQVELLRAPVSRGWSAQPSPVSASRRRPTPRRQPRETVRSQPPRASPR